jgi:glycosyltransferase involved in cell wall biosynthesis
MISIIICSRQKSIDPEFSKNIRDTIGCDHELVIIDNSANTHSIFEAYNLGIEKSAGELLCFLHDDILLHTSDWGAIITATFENNPAIGLLGVAGAKMKTNMPSGWWDCPEELRAVNIIQRYPDGQSLRLNYGFNENKLLEVVVIDGVFMAMKKKDNLTFNSEFKGFHCYDLDISLACKKLGRKVYVTNEVLIEHLSSGSLNESWLKATIKFHKVYRKWLPAISSCPVDRRLVSQVEFNNGKRFFESLLRANMRKEAFDIWWRLTMMRPFSNFHRIRYLLRR